MAERFGREPSGGDVGGGENADGPGAVAAGGQ